MEVLTNKYSTIKLINELPNSQLHEWTLLRTKFSPLIFYIIHLYHDNDNINTSQDVYKRQVYQNIRVVVMRRGISRLEDLVVVSVGRPHEQGSKSRS